MDYYTLLNLISLDTSDKACFSLTCKYLYNNLYKHFKIESYRTYNKFCLNDKQAKLYKLLEEKNRFKDLNISCYNAINPFLVVFMYFYKNKDKRKLFIRVDEEYLVSVVIPALTQLGLYSVKPKDILISFRCRRHHFEIFKDIGKENIFRHFDVVILNYYIPIKDAYCLNFSENRCYGHLKCNYTSNYLDKDNLIDIPVDRSNYEVIKIDNCYLSTIASLMKDLDELVILSKDRTINLNIINKSEFIPGTKVLVPCSCSLWESSKNQEINSSVQDVKVFSIANCTGILNRYLKYKGKKILILSNYNIYVKSKNFLIVNFPLMNDLNQRKIIACYYNPDVFTKFYVKEELVWVKKY